MQALNTPTKESLWWWRDHERLHSTMCDLTVRRNMQQRQKETKKCICAIALKCEEVKKKIEPCTGWTPYCAVCNMLCTYAQRYCADSDERYYMFAPPVFSWLRFRCERSRKQNWSHKKRNVCMNERTSIRSMTDFRRVKKHLVPSINELHNSSEAIPLLNSFRWHLIECRSFRCE